MRENADSIVEKDDVMCLQQFVCNMIAIICMLSKHVADPLGELSNSVEGEISSHPFQL